MLLDGYIWGFIFSLNFYVFSKWMNEWFKEDFFLIYIKYFMYLVSVW